MKFTDLKGKTRYKNFSKYRINWNKQERSKFQTEVKIFLYPYLKNHIVFSEMPVVGTLLKIDIYDATSQVAYEIQGRQHDNYIKFFAGNRVGYLKSIQRDYKKRKFCEINNIKLVEIFEEDLPLTKQWFLEKYQIYL